MCKIVRIVSLLLFPLAYFLCDKATWGFTTTRLFTTRDLGFTNAGTLPPLNQKFILAAQGGQSYVFFSEDGKYVLKFFKDMPRPYLPIAHYQQKKLGKLKRTLNGYALAYEHLPDETGLVYLHLQPSSSPLMTTLIDRLHISHTLDLSHTYFVIQKRATPLTSEPPSLLLTHLLEKRSSAHIADHDRRLHSNLGWIDDQLVYLDPGRFVYEP